MQEASIQGLWFIVILILGYYAFKWLARIFLPFIMQKAVRNFEKKAREQQGYQNPADHVQRRAKQLLINNQDHQRKVIIALVNMLILKRLMNNGLPDHIKIEFSL